MCPYRKSPAVPEVAIDEDRNLALFEYEIGLSRKRCLVAGKNQPGGFKQCIQVFLRRRVFRLVARHYPAALFDRHHVCHWITLRFSRRGFTAFAEENFATFNDELWHIRIFRFGVGSGLNCTRLKFTLVA